MSHRAHVPACISALAFAFALTLATLGIPAAHAAPTASVIANAPVKNWKLASFNDAGFRIRLLRGSEARYINATQIDIVDLNFAQFYGDGSTRTESVLLAPTASVLIEGEKQQLRGDDSMRLIRDDLEATGEKWTYDHTGKKLIITQNVRVVFHAPLKDILK